MTGKRSVTVEGKASRKVHLSSRKTWPFEGAESGALSWDSESDKALQLWDPSGELRGVRGGS